MTSRLDEVLAALIQREGGFVNHPDDRGGATKYGVTLKTLREWRRDQSLTARDVEDLQIGEAMQIYRAEYWFGPGFHKVEAISTKIAEELLDTGVNMGPGTAVKFLQRALSAFNNKGAYYDDLRADGVLGTKTLNALTSFLFHRKQDGEKVLLFTLDALQTEGYIKLAESDDRQESFAFGQILHRAVAGWHTV